MSVGEVCISVIDIGKHDNCYRACAQVVVQKSTGMDSGAALGYCCIAVDYSNDDRKSAEPCSEQLSYRKFQRKTLC